MCIKEHLRTIEVLDKGFVSLVDYMGSDRDIARAARCSYGNYEKETKDEADAKLVRRLMRDHHTSPFEMPVFRFFCKMPISTARQWIRHRTASVNEYSTRYSEVKDEFYIADEARMLRQHTANKQMSGDILVDNPKYVQERLTNAAAMCYSIYSDFLEEGLAREVARDVLPLNTYTVWVWQINLHNLLHFLNLRTAPDAQYEIRSYANAMKELITPIVPVTIEAWEQEQAMWAEFIEWRNAKEKD